MHRATPSAGAVSVAIGHAVDSPPPSTATIDAADITSRFATSPLATSPLATSPLATSPLATSPLATSPLASLLLVTSLVAACASAPAPPPPATAASPSQPSAAQPDSSGAQAFLRLAALEGRWATTKGFPATFTRVGRGTAVTQDSGFFVVWYPDGDALVAALFPDDGYHARMRSRRIVEANGELVIELVSEHTGNIAPRQPIARSLTLTLAPNNATVTQHWLFHTDAGDEPFELVLRRAK